MKRAALALLCLLGCAPAEQDEVASFARTAQPISGGVEDTTSKAVVGIVQASGSLCTGSLIAPNVVLTARHCVSPTTGDGSSVVCGTTGFLVPRPASSFFVSTADMVSVEDAGEYLVQEVVTLPDQESNVDDFCGNDIAILILKESVQGVAPYIPRLDDAPVVAGEIYSAVGFGAVNGQGDDSGTRRRRDGIAVECVSSDCEDHEIFGGHVRSSEWIGEGGVCQGDSGGPALDDQDRVFGVTSRGQADCGVSIYAYTVSHGQWLKDTVVYASGIGVYQAPAWTAGSTVDPEHSMPIGDPCDDDDDCPSGKCLDDAGNRYCTRACTEEASCPVDYRCIEDPTFGAVCAVDTSKPQGNQFTTPPERNSGCAVRPPARRAPDAGWLWALAGLAWCCRRTRRRS